MAFSKGERRPLVEGDQASKKALLDNDNHSHPASSSSSSSSSSGAIDNEVDRDRVSFVQLYRYANCFDRVLMLLGTFLAILDGAGPAIMAIVFGQMANELIKTISFGFADSPGRNMTTPAGAASPGNIGLDNNTAPAATATGQLTRQGFEAVLTTVSLYYVFLGCAMYVASSGQIMCWRIVCERVTHRIRKAFFRSILRQELTWFDENQSGALSAKLNDDIERVHDGTGDQVGLMIKNTSSFLCGFLVGFTVSWKLTLVILAVTPIIGGLTFVVGRVLATSVKREQQKYASAGALAEEALVSIRTVFALGGGQLEVLKFKRKIDASTRLAIQKYYKLAIILGSSMGILYTTYGLALYEGAVLIGRGELSPGQTMSVIMAVMMGANAIGNTLSPLQTVLIAASSASIIYKVIDSTPSIDAYSERGLRLARVMANIKFENVSFAYPTRKAVPVMRNMSFELSQGKTIAMCGRTGSGKSTIVNLLLRFYDPDEGCIYLDNCDLRDMNVAWLRSLIGIVEQEPALFDCSVRENIALGASSDSEQTSERIVEAAKLANAHDFITQLPQGYETRCGDRGVQMSGGQKQRIAIARALLGDPKILLLDEATSALDSTSESIVQSALNKARQGRTTVVIAHRLSTIRDADLICVLDSGAIIEMGKHDELMARRGDYFGLVTNQMFTDSDGDSGDKADGKTTSPSRGSVRAPMASSESEDFDDGSARPGAGAYRQQLFNESVSLLKSDTKSSRKSLGGHSTSGSKSRHSKTLYESIHGPYKSQKTGDQDTDEDQIEPPTTRDFVSLIRPELGLLIVAVTVSCLSGTLLPLFGLLYAEMIGVLSKTGDELLSSAAFWSLMFLAMGVATLITMALRVITMAYCCEISLARIRVECYANIVRQHIGWFDRKTNSPQRLTTRLASDAPMIKSIYNSRAISLFSGMSTIATSLVIAFYIGWQLAFLLLIIVPILIYASFLETRMMRTRKMDDLKRIENASRLATEAVEHVKIIQAINKEAYFLEKFSDELEGPFRAGVAGSRIQGAIYGFTQSFIYFVYGASFRFGGYLIATEQMDAMSVFRVFFAVAFTAISVGQFGGFGGDIDRANKAVARIIKLLNTQTAIDSSSKGGIRPRLKGAVTFRDVHFAYPSRPDTTVLQNFNLTIKPGQTLALVGPSGNGKSTLASLLLRFYDPDRGLIQIDDFDVRCINLAHLRQSVGLVSQEPCLFKTTIRENILYGLDKSRYSMRDIIEAAKMANIDDFISSLPRGYETQVGERGQQMSGGQKQRIAIARMMVRNPSILILDEATSALDAESEALVSEALEKAAKGKTCIKIAHRLSTVRDANQIAVIERGQIVELGTHDQLIALGKRGHYFRLMQKQEFFH